MIHFTKEALRVMTREQREAILRLARNEMLSTLVVTKGSSLDLPDGYLAFVQHWRNDSQSIYGGIAANGDVST